MSAATDRGLSGVPVPRGPAGVDALAGPLRRALAGQGPAVAPLPGEHGPARAVRASLRPDDPAAPLESSAAVVLATSGSTGAPKGVLLNAAALTASAVATEERLGGPGQWTLALPLTSVAGVQVLVRSLLAGTTPVSMEWDDGFRPEAFAQATGQLTGDRRYTALVPTQLQRLLGSAEGAEALRTYDTVLLGGAAPPPALLRQAETAEIAVVVTYGMTETCGGCLYDGVPLRDVEARIGADGRIELRGPVLFSGYRLRPDLTAAALRDGWLVTADLGRITGDGWEILGRADDVVVTGGVNVALGAVEAALAEHPGVVDAVAVGLPDEEWGTRVVAVVTGTVGTGDIEVLRTYVRERLGAAAVPRDVLLTDELPRLPAGKVDRSAARRLAESSAERAG